MKKVIFGETFFTREETEQDAFELLEAILGEKMAIWMLSNIFTRIVLCVGLIVATPITIAIRVPVALIKAILKSFAIVIQEIGSTANFITNPWAFKHIYQEDEHL